MPRKKKTTKNSSSSLQGLSIAQLNEEIERRRSGAVELAEERAELMERVAEIDAYLAELGVSTTTGRPRGRPRKSAGGAARSHGGGRKRAAGRSSKKATSKKSTSKKASRKKASRKKARTKAPSKPAGSRKRHRNDTNLVGALQQVLSGKVMGVTEAAEAVQQSGYKTTSPNFRTIVNQTLIKNPDVFTKQGRGRYTAK